MSRCYAFTKDYKPCRNYAEIIAYDEGLDGVKEVFYGDTCRLHRGFFNTWLDRLPTFAHGLEWRPMFRNHIARVLKADIKRVPPLLFADLTRYNGNYDHFFYLCAKHMEGFRFSMNPQLCIESMRACWWQSQSIGPVKIPPSYRLDFYRCMEDPKQGFFTVLQTCGIHQQPTLGQLMSVVDQLLDSEAGRFAVLDASFPNESSVQSLLQFPHLASIHDMIASGEFTAYLLFHRQEVYTKCQRRLDPIREELLSVAWMPERVLEWCCTDAVTRWQKK